MPDQAGPTPDPFVNATLALSDDEFFALYGPWTPMRPEEIGEMLSDCPVGWHVAGGRAARAGAAATRHHEDTDVVVLAKDLDAIRAAMPGWHLWENINGAFRPLLPGIADRPECHQVWVRRDARSPWRLEFLVDRASTAEEWVFKRDHSVRVPWDRALHQLGGVTYLRPELALLFKAGQDREKDREDLAAARLTPEGRRWLAATLERLGYTTWAELTRRSH
jgi:hypothetical protein